MLLSLGFGVIELVFFYVIDFRVFVLLGLLVLVIEFGSNGLSNW